MKQDEFSEWTLDVIEKYWPWVVMLLTVFSVLLLATAEAWSLIVGGLLLLYCGYYWARATKQGTFAYRRKSKRE